MTVTRMDNLIQKRRSGLLRCATCFFWGDKSEEVQGSVLRPCHLTNQSTSRPGNSWCGEHRLYDRHNERDEEPVTGTVTDLVLKTVGDAMAKGFFDPIFRSRYTHYDAQGAPDRTAASKLVRPKPEALAAAQQRQTSQQKET